MADKRNTRTSTTTIDKGPITKNSDGSSSQIVKRTVETIFKANTTQAQTGLRSVASILWDIKSAALGVSGAFLGWSVSRNLFSNLINTEEQIIKLKTALQDAKAGADEFRKAMRFAASTPFPVDQVTQAAVMLRVFQFNPFEKVERGGRMLVEVLGDMAGAMGRDIALASHAFNRALVGEWEIMQNNFQISAKTIPQLKGLATGTKEYGEAIIKYIVAQQRFVGGMELTAKSVVGMISNIKDAFTVFNTALVGVADSEQELKGLTFYDKFKEDLKELYDVVTDRSVITMFEVHDTAIESLKKKLKTLPKGAAEYLKTLEKISVREKELSEVRRKAMRYGLTGKTELAGLVKQIQTLRAAGKSDVEIKARLITEGVSPDALMDQYEKIEMMGRVASVGLMALQTLILGPIKSGFAELSHWAMAKTSQFLNSVVSIQQIAGASASNATAIAASDVKGFIDITNKYIGWSMKNSTKESEEAMIQIRKSLLANQDPTLKQIQIFLILTKLLFTLIGLELEQFFKENPLGRFLMRVWKLVTTFGGVLWSVFVDRVTMVATTAASAIDTIGGAVFGLLEEVGLTDLGFFLLEGRMEVFKVVATKAIEAVGMAFRIRMIPIKLLIGALRTIVGLVKDLWAIGTGEKTLLGILSGEEESKTVGALKATMDSFEPDIRAAEELFTLPELTPVTASGQAATAEILKAVELIKATGSNRFNNAADEDLREFIKTGRLNALGEFKTKEDEQAFDALTKKNVEQLKIQKEIEQGGRAIKKAIEEKNDKTTVNVPAPIINITNGGDNLTDRLRRLAQEGERARLALENAESIRESNSEQARVGFSQEWSVRNRLFGQYQINSDALPTVVEGIKRMIADGASRGQVSSEIDQYFTADRAAIRSALARDNITGYSKGLERVPDTLAAILHKDEMVLSAPEANAFRYAQNRNDIHMPTRGKMNNFMRAAYSGGSMPDIATPGAPNTNPSVVKNFNVNISQTFNGSGAIKEAPRMFDAGRELAKELDFAVAG